MTRAILGAALLGASSAIACEDGGGVPLSPQNGAAPQAVLILEDIPLAQPFSAMIKVCDTGARTEVEFDAIMPAHQHGMNYVPTITKLDAGRFLAEGLVFHMPGAWEIQVEVKQETGVSRYIHTVTVR